MLCPISDMCIVLLYENLYAELCNADVTDANVFLCAVISCTEIDPSVSGAASGR